MFHRKPKEEARLYDVPAEGVPIEWVIYRKEGSTVDTACCFGPPIGPGTYWSEVRGDILQTVSVPSLLETQRKCYSCQRTFRPGQWIMWSKNLEPFQLVNIEAEVRWWVQKMDKYRSDPTKPYITQLDVHPDEQHAAAHWDCVRDRPELKELAKLDRDLEKLREERCETFDAFFRAVQR